MSLQNSSETYNELGGNKERSLPQGSVNPPEAIFTTSEPVDILICGTCSSQFSYLKQFIDHKQCCGSSTSNNESTLHNSSQPSTSMATTMQTLSTASSTGSIMGLPVGTPHVILQTSSGIAQMYRIVLEPSLNGAQISSTNQLTPTSTNILEHSQYETSIGTTIPTKQDSYEVEKLHNMEPIEQSWVSGVMSSDLHSEEEDVATFLATQLAASQSTSHHSKTITEQVSKAASQEIREHKLQLEENQTMNQEIKDPDLVPLNEGQKYTNLEPLIKIQQMDSQTEVTSDSVLADKLNQELKQYRRQKLACSFENCKYQTIYQKDMARHYRIHTGEKPFDCTLCGSKFSRQDKLKVHTRIHKNERPYVCKEAGCFYSAIEKAHLTKHMRTHTDERPYKCQLCPYAARDGSQLTVHLRSHTGDTPFHCQTDGCLAAFKTSSDLRRHERLHTGEKPYKCTECDYASALKSNLKVHFRINHYKCVKFGCRVCPFTGTAKKQLKEHEKTHPGLVPVEEKEPEYNFGQTVARKHQGYSRGKSRSKPACVKNFVCQQCGSGFVRLDSYKSHMRQHDKHNVLATRDLVKFPDLMKCKNKLENYINVVIQGEEVTNVSSQNEKPASAETRIGETPSSEGFSSYVITIDGISSTYPPAGIRPHPVAGENLEATIDLNIPADIQHLKTESSSSSLKDPP